MLTRSRPHVIVAWQVTGHEHVVEIADDVQNANLVAYKSKLASPSPPAYHPTPPPTPEGEPPRSARWAKKKTVTKPSRKASPKSSPRPSPSPVQV